MSDGSLLTERQQAAFDADAANVPAKPDGRMARVVSRLKTIMHIGKPREALHQIVAWDKPNFQEAFKNDAPPLLDGIAKQTYDSEATGSVEPVIQKPDPISGKDIPNVRQDGTIGRKVKTNTLETTQSAESLLDLDIMGQASSTLPETHQEQPASLLELDKLGEQSTIARAPVSDEHDDVSERTREGTDTNSKDRRDGSDDATPTAESPIETTRADRATTAIDAYNAALQEMQNSMSELFQNGTEDEQRAFLHQLAERTDLNPKQKAAIARQAENAIRNAPEKPDSIPTSSSEVTDAMVEEVTKQLGAGVTDETKGKIKSRMEQAKKILKNPNTWMMVAYGISVGLQLVSEQAQTA